MSQHGKEIDMSPSSSPQQRRSCTKTFAQRKGSKTRSKKTGNSLSCDVGSDKTLIKDKAEEACARLHSGIRPSVIYEVNKNSTEEEDKNGRKTPTMKPQTTTRRQAVEV